MKYLSRKHCGLIIAGVLWMALLGAGVEGAQPRRIHRVKDAAGGIYVGEALNGKWHGRGTYTWPDGGRYTGQWQAGVQHGKGSIKWANGNSYTGGWVRGGRTGQGTMTWPDGGRYTGQWQAGVQHGKGSIKWANGNSYTGDWVRGGRTGRGTMTWPDGGRYTGQWKDSLRHGYGAHTLRNGERYAGWWSADKRHGAGRYTWPNGLRYVGHFKSGRFVGGWSFHPAGGVSWTKQTDQGGWQTDRVAPSWITHFNNGTWNDLTGSLSKGNLIYFHTDTKQRGDTEIVLYAAYRGPQQFDTGGYCTDPKAGNRGRLVKLQARLVARPQKKGAPYAALAAQMAREGVPKPLQAGFERSYVYRLKLSLNDGGDEARYWLRSDALAQKVVGRAWLDVVGAGHIARAQTGLFALRRGGPDKPADPDDPDKPTEDPTKGPGTLITAAKGGTITHQSGAKLVIPAGVLKRDAKANIDVKKPTHAAPLASTKLGSKVYDITVAGQTEFDKPLTVTLPYTDADLCQGAKATDLMLAYFDEEAGAWLLETGAKVDTQRKTVIVQTGHLTSWTTVSTTSDWIIYADANVPGASNPTYAATVRTALEDADKWLQSKGYRTRVKQGWKTSVYIKALADANAEAKAKNGRQWQGWRWRKVYDLNSYIYVAAGRTDMTRLKETVAHEYWHLCQDLYFPNVKGTPEVYWWLAEATVPPVTDCIYPTADYFLSLMHDYRQALHEPMSDHSNAPPKQCKRKERYLRRLNHGYGQSAFLMYVKNCGLFPKGFDTAELVHKFYEGLGTASGGGSAKNMSEKDPLKAMDKIIGKETVDKRSLANLYTNFCMAYWQRTANLGGKWRRTGMPAVYVNSDPPSGRISFDQGAYSTRAWLVRRTAKSNKATPDPLVIRLSGATSAYHTVLIYAGEKSRSSFKSSWGLKKYDNKQMYWVAKNAASVSIPGFGSPVGGGIKANALVVIVVNTDEKASFKGTLTIGSGKGGPYAFKIEQADLPGNWTFIAEDESIHYSSPDRKDISDRQFSRTVSFITKDLAKRVQTFRDRKKELDNFLKSYPKQKLYKFGGPFDEATRQPLYRHELLLEDKYELHLDLSHEEHSSARPDWKPTLGNSLDIFEDGYTGARKAGSLAVFVRSTKYACFGVSAGVYSKKSWYGNAISNWLQWAKNPAKAKAKLLDRLEKARKRIMSDLKRRRSGRNQKDKQAEWQKVVDWTTQAFDKKQAFIHWHYDTCIPEMVKALKDSNGPIEQKLKQIIETKKKAP